MCDPLTIGLISGVASLGASLAAPKPASPPPIPAAAPDNPRAPGATVRVGDGQNDNTSDNSNTATVTPQTEKRVFGKPVGGLGRSTDLAL